MKKFLIQTSILIFAIFISNVAFSQTANDYLKERIINSQTVIEGKVISKDAFWDNSKSKIFTENKIEVFKVFKGRISKDTISIITKGGIMEDHFLILSHHPDFSVGMEGVFFCEENNFEDLPSEYSNQLKVHGGEHSFIRYYNDGVNPAAADKKRTYKNIQSELYPSLQLFSKQKIRTVQPNSKEQQINEWLVKSGIQVGLNKSPDNSPESPETDINIEFEFSNVVINSQGELDFDIMAKTNTANILLSEASVFVAYNPSVFGDNVVSNNVVEVSKGTIIQDSEYQLQTYDLDNSTVQIDASGLCKKEANLYQMALGFEQFCHVKLSTISFDQLASLSFDEFKMDGSMKYFDTQRNECVDFDDVIVSDPINTFSSPTANVSIEYNLRNVEITNSGGNDFLEFDITAKAGKVGTLFSFAEIFMNFNTSTFGVDVTSNGNLFVFKNTSFLNSNYSAVHLDESGGTAFGIDIVSTGTDNLVELPLVETELVHVKLTIQNCNTSANVNFDEAAMLTGSTHFVGNSMPIPHETYFPVTAEDEINSALCPSNALIYFAPNTAFSGDAIAFNSASGSRINDCTNQNGERVSWFVDVDIAIKQSQTWNFPVGGSPGMNMVDFPSVILHELGHSHRLDHAIPRDKVMFWMVGQNPPNNSGEAFQVLRDFNQADIDGGIEVLKSSQTRINGSGCNNIIPIKIFKTCSTGIKEIDDNISSINIYPNPIEDNFQLEIGLKNSLEIKVEMFDILGRMVYFEDLGKVSKGNHSLPIFPPSKLAASTYLINIKGDNQILSTFKIVKL